MARLKQPALAKKVRRAYVQDGMKDESDPDAALYGAFLLDEDKARANHLYAEIEAGRWSNMDFRDQRLRVLATRMKARSFAHLLDVSKPQTGMNTLEKSSLARVGGST